MNNSRKGFIQNDKFLNDLCKLHEQSRERFDFLKTFIETIARRESSLIKISMSLDEPVVSIIMGEYMYKETFISFEDARSFIDIVKSVNKEVA